MARAVSLLIDGNNVATRIFYAQSGAAKRLPDPREVARVASNQIKSFGQQVGARAKHSFVVFDATNGGGWRRDAYPEYKATRKAPEGELRDALRESLAAVRDALVHGLHITEMTQEGWEADDVLATLAVLTKEYGRRGVLVSSDKDLIQCVNGDVSLISPEGKPSDPLLTPVNFFERRGFSCDLMADYKALVGDPSDNIPPGGGIGEKSAPTLLRMFGPLDNCYARIGDIEEERSLGPRIANALRENEEKIRRNLWLTTLRTDVPGVTIPLPPIPDASVVKVGWYLVSSPNQVTCYKVRSLHDPDEVCATPYAKCEVVRTYLRGSEYLGRIVLWPLPGLLTSLAIETLELCDKLPAPILREGEQALTSKPAQVEKEERLEW